MKMPSNIKLMVDSTSDLSKELLDQYDISVVPLYVVMGAQSYKDNIDIMTGELYRRSDEEGIIPKTAAPSPADFIHYFEKALKEGKQILYISMSSKVSSTNQNAHIAASELPHGQVHIVDSMHLSASYAMLVVRAARALEEGCSLEQVIKDIENVREKVNIEVFVDRLDYLYKGGRVSSLQHLIGNVLKVRPVLNIIQGEVRSIRKYRGKMEKALDGVVQKIVSRKDEICPNVLIIAQTFAEKMTDKLYASLMQTNHFKDIILIEGGCVIGSHTGPGSIAVSYIDL